MQKPLTRILTLTLGLVLCHVASTWACQPYRDVLLDRSGNVIPSVAVTVLYVNTNSIATIYSDANCAVTMPNPLMTDSTGTFTFYATDSDYALTFAKTGYSFANVAQLTLYDPVLENIVPFAKFATDDLSVIGTGAIDSIGAAVKALEINKPARVSQTKTCPATLTLLVTGSGTITVAGGAIFTVTCRIINLTGHPILLGTGTYTFTSNDSIDPYGRPGTSTVTYSAAMTIDATAGANAVITATNNTAFTIAAPTPASVPIGFRLRVTLINTSGGALGAATWNAVFKMATWTNPANATSRAIDFEWNGVNYVEKGRTTADIPN